MSLKKLYDGQIISLQPRNYHNDINNLTCCELMSWLNCYDLALITTWDFSSFSLKLY